MDLNEVVANCPNCGAPLTAFNTTCPYCGTISPKTLILDKTEPITVTFTGFDSKFNSKKRTMRIRLDTMEFEVVPESMMVFADDFQYRSLASNEWRIKLEGILLPMGEGSGNGYYLMTEEQR